MGNETVTFLELKEPEKMVRMKRTFVHIAQAQDSNRAEQSLRFLFIFSHCITLLLTTRSTPTVARQEAWRHVALPIISTLSSRDLSVTKLLRVS